MMTEGSGPRKADASTTRKYGGSGLGLAIVRKILEDHGGRIELVDAPAVASGGRGAMVRLHLPAETATGETTRTTTKITHANEHATEHGSTDHGV